MEENYVMLHATNFLQKNKIPCFKYNYSLDEEVQNFCSFPSYIQVSEDGEELIIINKKPTEKLVDYNSEMLYHTHNGNTSHECITK